MVVNRATDGPLSDVWVLDTATDRTIRFTRNPQIDAFPVWSPDGQHIAFQSYQTGLPDIYRKRADNTGPEELILSTSEVKHPMDWSSGGFLLFRNQPFLSQASQWDLWAVEMGPAGPEGRKAFPVVQTNADERDGQFSPDGNWIAFESNETGHYEIYVQPFPSGPRTPISSGGGAQVRWSGDGKELFYIALDGRLMAVPIRLGRSGEAPEVGAPVALFATNLGGAIVQGVTRQQYDVSRDGRFLMNTLVEDPNASPMTLILNWTPKP